ncbi:MAG: SRPBCC family protein [Pyrinomonadaceae bacterium]|nr:SRPBCC family protein [Pyrinomonadaceae bacterium]
MKFVKESVIKAAPERVFAFHELPDALEKLMPPWENAKVIQPPTSLKVGTVVIIELKVFGIIPQKLVAKHTKYDPPRMFEDTLIESPFAFWRHQHIISAHESGATLRDEIEFEPPFWIFGRIAAPFAILPTIQKTFDYRHEVTKKWCESES